MASLMHSLTGRKQESDVWQHFTFFDFFDKLKCIKSKPFPWKLNKEKVTINDALPLKATQRDAIAKLKYFGASNRSCRQTQCSFI